jgi:hypothetical protein
MRNSFVPRKGKNLNSYRQISFLRDLAIKAMQAVTPQSTAKKQTKANVDPLSNLKVGSGLSGFIMTGIVKKALGMVGDAVQEQQNTIEELTALATSMILLDDRCLRVVGKQFKLHINQISNHSVNTTGKALSKVNLGGFVVGETSPAGAAFQMSAERDDKGDLKVTTFSVGGIDIVHKGGKKAPMSGKIIDV